MAEATVLVVDDDPDVRRLLDDALRRAGYRVLLAADGEAALLLARSNSPEVALVDIVMRGLDGFTLAARLRAGGYAGPIALMSAWHDTSPMPEFPFVAKPLDLPALRKLIAELISS